MTGDGHGWQPWPSGPSGRCDRAVTGPHN